MNTMFGISSGIPAEVLGVSCDGPDYVKRAVKRVLDLADVAGDDERTRDYISLSAARWSRRERPVRRIICLKAKRKGKRKEQA